MPEDRKKTLEALVAKRKADNDLKVHKKPKPSLPPSGKSPAKSDKHKAKPAVLKNPKASKPKPKKPRYSDEDSEEDDDILSDDQGSDEDIKKKSKTLTKKPLSKPLGKVSHSPVKAAAKIGSGSASNGKGKGIEKAKPETKVVKGKKKADDSDDDDVSLDEEDDAGGLSDDPLDEVDTSNILEGRTRRRAAQTAKYDFGDASDGDDDSD